jgi:hypothetical protein
VQIAQENEMKWLKKTTSPLKKGQDNMRKNPGKQNNGSQELKSESKENNENINENLKIKIKNQQEELNVNILEIYLSFLKKNLREQIKEKELNFEFLSQTPIPKEKSTQKAIISEKIATEVIDEIKLTFILKNLSLENLETVL